MDRNELILQYSILNFPKFGGPGEKFKEVYLKAEAAMDLPKNVMKTFDFPEDLQDQIQSGFPIFDDQNLPRDQRMNQTMYGEGKYHLTPSFF